MALPDFPQPGDRGREGVSPHMQSFLDGRFLPKGVEPVNLAVVGELRLPVLQLRNTGYKGGGPDVYASLFNPSHVPSGASEEIRPHTIGIFPLRGSDPVALTLGMETNSPAGIILSSEEDKIIVNPVYNMGGDVERFIARVLADTTTPMQIRRATFQPSDFKGRYSREHALARVHGVSRLQGFIAHLPSETFLPFMRDKAESGQGTTVEPGRAFSPTPRSNMQVAMVVNSGRNPIHLHGPGFKW